MSDAPARPRSPIQARPQARPASAAQSGIWFNEQLDDCGAVHHVPFTLHFDGALDTAALRRACDAVLRRHPDLTSAVENRDGAPYLVPASVRPELTTERADAEATRQHITAPFDLAEGPLCRLVLQIIGPREHRLLVVAHHLVFDGHSMELFAADLAALYGAEAGHGTPVPPEPAPAEPIGAEDARIAAKLPAARDYWARHPLGDGDVVLPGLERPAHGAAPGASAAFRLPEDLRSRLAPLAERLGITRFELIVASLHALLYRYGNGAPVTALDLGTRTPEQQTHIGVHVNELPFTTAPEPGLTFAEFARATRAGLRELYRVRDVPLGRAGTGVKPAVALAPVSLTYRRPGPAPDFPGLTVSADWTPSNHTARNALRIELVDGPDAFHVLLQYPPQSIAREHAESLARHWLTLLGHTATDPDTPLAGLPLLDTGERDRVLARLNDTAVAYPARTVPELIAEQAARQPDAVAVVHADRRLTYAELDAGAERLAARLRAKGIGAGALVAVRASRSERLLIGLLGVLKAGAAYIPLDAEYPPERIEFVLADADAAHELGDADLSAEAVVADGEPLSADTPLPSPAPADLAYVIYTSGSTGRPKGVQIEHRSLTNLLLSLRDLLGSGPGHRWLALTSVSFDISGLELFLPLVTGGTVVVAGAGDTRDGAALADLIARHGITHVQATPTGWAMLLDNGFDAPAVTALAGGEALPPTLARRLRPRVGRLLNVYGPTETTIWSTYDEIDTETDEVTIGRPLANTRVYVLDECLEPVPAGLPGDLYIAGAGLARGYVGRPELDSERFLPDPFGPPGSRMYRTGDRARRRADGRLDFLGRTDDQIKLRGYRIELGEIESRLLALEGVDRAAAAVRDGRLIGYYAGAADAGRLRRDLAPALPPYMVPEVFVALEALPTTPNGKLDRPALPAPPEETAAQPSAADSPLEAVRDIWREVLGLPELTDTDDIFDLGGHSITMTQISTRILDRLGVEVPLSAYFDAPTVEGIAAVVAELQEEFA
ncbi:non-ribosomal peptide synthetase [Streptomyces rimosus]|uniref:non-ribosomal peptide synthetase n=1 Tax=Streptomyces rimosus TaxID=1927 RepID=UPI00067BA7F5|nr:non-ribosomal peptide synthetase [Streptomyces rimosus]